jgi:flagellar secretion chaperone FliS
MNTALYRAANTYANVDLETSVQGANPHRLILMLFEAAILSVNKAQRYMEVENIAMKGMTISKAIQIIDEGLSASLDESQGGDLAKQLKDLYGYMSRRLLLASMRNEPAGLVEVSKLLSELKDAWAAIGQNGVNTYENLRSATQRVAA